MANIPCLGGAPVSFIDASGNQYFIPLPYVSFPAPPAAAIPAISAQWPGWLAAGAAAQQNTVNGWVGALAIEGYLAAGSPPASPAFALAARDAGSAGNDISITFGNIAPNTATPPSTTADVSVTTTQVYKGLTVASVETVLGATALGGTQPGLAFVGSPFTTLPDAVSPAQNFVISGTNYEFAVPGSGGGILVPTNDATNPDAGLITVAITDIDTTAETFTLTLGWTKPAAPPLNVALSALASTFGYVLTVTPPAGGYQLPPAAGTYTLVGGADAIKTSAPPVPAQATIPSS